MSVLREAQDFCLIFDLVDSGLWTGKMFKQKKKRKKGEKEVWKKKYESKKMKQDRITTQKMHLTVLFELLYFTPCLLQKRTVRDKEVEKIKQKTQKQAGKSEFLSKVWILNEILGFRFISTILGKDLSLNQPQISHL